MSLPVVAIVGRPNVGKSSLLNRVARRRVSIVEPTPGVTRDRVSTRVTLEDRLVELVDTGGMGLFDEVLLRDQVEAQIHRALVEADLLLFLVDARDGLAPLDEEAAATLRRSGKKVILVANKAETEAARQEAPGFARLGFGEPHLVSALEGFGVPELLEKVAAALPPPGEERSIQEPLLKVAIVGRRNVGKSSLTNYLAGEERVIVSELPGTTRDAVDVLIDLQGRRLLVIDTAGLRRRTTVQDAVELFSVMRAQQAAARADVVLFLFAVDEPIGRLEKRLARFLLDHHKPVVLVGSKWDLARERTRPEQWEAYLRRELPGLAFAPISFLSARDGFHVRETMDLAWELAGQATERVGTGELNRIFQEAVATLSPRAKRGARAPRIFYATQVDVRPPTMVLFVNDPSLFTKDYERFLQNRLRETLPFPEVPIRLHFRARDKVALPGGDGSRRTRRQGR